MSGRTLATLITLAFIGASTALAVIDPGGDAWKAFFIGAVFAAIFSIVGEE